jgi:hypothetical protein
VSNETVKLLLVAVGAEMREFVLNIGAAEFCIKFANVLNNNEISKILYQSSEKTRKIRNTQKVHKSKIIRKYLTQ